MIADLIGMNIDNMHRDTLVLHRSIGWHAKTIVDLRIIPRFSATVQILLPAARPAQA
jgi:hypothetical protein